MAQAHPKIRLENERVRAFDVLAIGQARAPFDDLYHFVLSRPWWQFFVLTTAIYLASNALFALAFLLQPGCISNARPGSFEDAFSFSVQTFATIGYGAMAPATSYANALVTVEALTGILGTALVTGITFAKFARPTARVLFAEKAVIFPRNGVPHLMFRVANWRHNQIIEAQLRVSVLVGETTSEGETIRRLTDVTLLRDRSPLFSLSWTAMHRVDEDSPFFGDRLVGLRAERSIIVVTLTGIDETFAQNVYARHTYEIDKVVVNGRFADVTTVRDDGMRVIDYTRFHEVILSEPPPAPRPESAA